MVVADRVSERKILLKRSFSKARLFQIGRDLNIPYFDQFISGWDVDEEKAAFKIASTISEDGLLETFRRYSPRRWVVFRGQYYTYEKGVLALSGSWDMIQTNIRECKSTYGKDCSAVLRVLLKIGRSCNLREIEEKLREIGSKANPLPILEELGKLKIIVTSYSGGEYKEWEVPEEIAPIVWLEIGEKPLPKPMVPAAPTIPTQLKGEEIDYVQAEHSQIVTMDQDFNDHLNDLLKRRLNETIRFGKKTSASLLGKYLEDLFGPVLYFDSFLTIAQQYGLSNVEIVHEQGKTGIWTGFNLALFGEPGTGKSFATRDMILGKPDAKIPPHGIPGRNRYAGGMTPARFIRIGQAYAGQTYNFIIPEFNDWFKYKGMVEPLKLAMERGELKYELHREVIGPYRFNSFFSVNYNTAVYGRGYDVTVQDPNFQAVEDRMLCRLHRLTKSRYIEIAESQMRLALGEINIEEGAQQIRDHLTLIHAIETKHPFVRDRFPFKPVMITPNMYQRIGVARNAILERIPTEMVRFSARLEDRTVRLACALSLPKYFQSSQDFIPVDDDALSFAIRFYVEEASVRSREEFNVEEVLESLTVSKQP